jgi:exodeoxyribonuclease V gamma subunit
LESEPTVELSLAELQRFWRLPVQYFFNRRLKVVFDSVQRQAEDDEPFALDGLQSYQLRDGLLACLLKARQSGEDEQQAAEVYIRRNRAAGALPVGAFGELEFAANAGQSEALLDALFGYCQAPEPDLEVNLTLPVVGESGVERHCQLSGWLSNQYRSGMLRYRSGAIRARDYLAAWIDHLAMNLMGHHRPTHLLGLDKKQGVVHKVLPPIEAADARAELQQLVVLYYSGLNRPLAYFPRSAQAGVEQLLKNKADAAEKMGQAFNDSFLFAGEGSDAYIARVWPQWNDMLAQQALEYAQTVLLGAIGHTVDIAEYKS